MAEFKLKRVLCPVDFSEPSAAALRMAGGVAKAFGAELTVLHAQILEAPVYFTVAQAQALKAQLRRSTRAAHAHVADFVVKYLPADLTRSIEVVGDDPVVAILRTAKNWKAGLVVMGTHGRTGLTKVRLGSVMESVLRQTGVPVLTVGPNIKPVASLGVIRRILCPVNYSSLAEIAFEHARTLAEKTGAQLTLLNIAEETPSGQGLDEAQRVLCDWVAPAVRERCSVKEVARQGNSAEQIVAEAKSSGADLVVIGAQSRGSLGTMLFGSTTEVVIRRAPYPVFTVVRRERSPRHN